MHCRIDNLLRVGLQKGGHLSVMCFGYKSIERSSHGSKGNFVAPPKTSTLLSAHGMMLPGMLVEQFAMLTMSSVFRTRSQILNWLNSPTNACVASNLPPTVSFREKIKYLYFRWYQFVTIMYCTLNNNNDNNKLEIDFNNIDHQ